MLSPVQSVDREGSVAWTVFIQASLGNYEAPALGQARPFMCVCPMFPGTRSLMPTRCFACLA